jgi:uncharacterized damage-inducible protein DinB
MTENQLSLATFYAGWDVYQQQLVAAIAPLTAEQLALKSSPQNWSVGMLATHIIATRVGWFQRWMGVGKAELAGIGMWDEEGQPVRSAEELVSGLEVTWQMIQDALASWKPSDLAQSFRSGRENRPPRSRQWIIWHVLEHDIHHGGELSSILGAHGLAAVDLD